MRKQVDLGRKLALLRGALAQSAIGFWDHPDLATLYPRYLVAVHTVIRASVPLMEDALAVTRARYADQPYSKALADYLQKHIPEEMCHDEWLLDDLAELGISREIVMRHMPCPVAAAMTGSQYYYIRHVHPAVLLGYIAALEGFPPDEELIMAGVRRTGYSITSTRTLLEHAELDQGHFQELVAAIDAMDLDDRLLDLISSNGLQTIDYVIQLTELIVKGSLATILEHEYEQR